MVADVDGDGEAEIVVVTDNYWGGVVPGVRVYGEATGQWANARPLWNQFAYSVSNINDDAQRAAPTRTRDLALGHRWAQASVKDGVPPSCAFPQPDLTASALRIADTPSEWELTVRIGNGGARVVGPDVPVSFYDGDPRLGAAGSGRWPRPGTCTRASTRTSTLRPAALHDHPRRRSSPRPTTPAGLKGRILESDEQNNVLDGGQALVAAAGLPDLSVVDVDVSGLVGESEDARDLRSRLGPHPEPVAELPVGASFDVAFFEDRDGDGALGAADAELGRVSVERARSARDAHGRGAGVGIAVLPRQPGAGLRRRRFGGRGIRRDEQRRPRRRGVPGAPRGPALLAARGVGADGRLGALDTRGGRPRRGRRRGRGVRQPADRLAHDGRPAPCGERARRPAALLRPRPRERPQPRRPPRPSATSTATAGPRSSRWPSRATSSSPSSTTGR